MSYANSVDELSNIESNIADAIDKFGHDMTLGEAQSKLVQMLKEQGYYVYPSDNPENKTN